MIRTACIHATSFTRSRCLVSSQNWGAKTANGRLHCRRKSYGASMHVNQKKLSPLLTGLNRLSAGKVGQIFKYRSTRSKSIHKTSSSPMPAKRFKASAAPTMRNSSVAAQENQSHYFLDRMNVVFLTPRYIPIPRWITPRRYSFNLSECFGHFSFVLVAVSYATDDFLLLRAIAVAGSSFMMVFAYFHPHGRVLWLPLKWNALFILINSYRIGSIMYLQSVGSKLSEDLKRIKHDHFDAMELCDYVKLISISTEETFEGGALICHQGQKNRFIRLVIEGDLDVLRDGVHTYSLNEGNFASEAGLHAGLLLSGDVESSCTMIAKPMEPGKHMKRARVLRWDRSELIRLLNNENALRRALSAAMSWDIIRKLKGQRQYISDQKVDDPELWTRKRSEQTEDRYAAIIQNVLQCPDYFLKRRDELNKYRIIHHIDEEHHKLALEKCGWTLEEYEVGERRHNSINYGQDNKVFG